MGVLRMEGIEMEEKISLWRKITKRPKLIDVEQDLWIFYCPYCKRWEQGIRKSYTSDFSSKFYFECKEGHRIKAPREL